MTNTIMNNQVTFSFNLKNNDKTISNFISFIASSDYDKIKDKADSFLHENEMNYMNNIKTEKRKKSYLLGRFVSKEALSTYCKQDEKNKMEIQYGAFKQPIIKGDIPNTPQISISHINDLATAIVYEPGYNIGIDVEKIDPQRYESEQIAISESERRLIDEIDFDANVASTLLWTQKEALSKAIQTGFFVSFKVLGVKSVVKLGENCYKSEFEYFDNFHGYSVLLGEYILSLVVPQNIEFSFTMHSLNYFFNLN